MQNKKKKKTMKFSSPRVLNQLRECLFSERINVMKSNFMMQTNRY